MLKVFEIYSMYLLDMPCHGPKFLNFQVLAMDLRTYAP